MRPTNRDGSGPHVRLLNVTERKDHPVLWGLLALVAVAAGVGLVLGFGAVSVSKTLGLSGGSGGSAAAEKSMYLPTPSKTSSSPAGSDGESSGDSSSSSTSTGPSSPDSSSEAPAITLTSQQTQVAPMAQIDLSGTFPGGNGAILQVQRLEGGTWVDFPVTMSVNGDSYSTYILTGHTGVNKLRVIDTDSKKTSNVIKVRVG